jgi:NAD(P)-dependent dehydrogenase (short-subunit alcohol dehydrogenase family)
MTSASGPGGALVVIGSGDELDVLAAALDASSVDRLDPSDSATEWRERVAAGPVVDRVVVAMWPSARPEPCTLVNLDDHAWSARVQAPLSDWVAGLGAAARRVADGGRIVAVVDRPAPLDSVGHVAEAGVADAVEALVRSLARSLGARDVRVNAVTTPARVAPGTLLAPLPPLATHPGSVDREVAAAVQMLSGAGVLGVTGTVVHADAGRSWR